MKAPTIHQPQLLAAFHHLDLLCQLARPSTSRRENHWIISSCREETTWLESDWTEVERRIFIIHKNNSDIVHPWSKTWHLCWINARTLVLTFASLSDPQVAPSYHNRQHVTRESPRRPRLCNETRSTAGTHTMDNTHTHTHTVHSSGSILVSMVLCVLCDPCR